MNGLLIIDKPAGMTSHDVVSRLRKITAEKSIGHLGTLDPMATGVLPLLMGKFTRLAQYFSSAEKSYTGSIRFGFATDTYDAEGEPAGPDCWPQGPISLDSIRSAASRCGNRTSSKVTSGGMPRPPGLVTASRSSPTTAKVAVN